MPARPSGSGGPPPSARRRAPSSRPSPAAPGGGERAQPPAPTAPTARNSPRPPARHPGAPSRTGRGTLVEIIDADPERELGAPTLTKFGPRLPFLLKILAAGPPLPLQVHPDPVSYTPLTLSPFYSV